jgi:hypothetical protein
MKCVNSWSCESQRHHTQSHDGSCDFGSLHTAGEAHSHYASTENAEALAAVPVPGKFIGYEGQNVTA